MILCYLTKKYNLVTNQYKYTKKTHDDIKNILKISKDKFKTFKSNYLRNCMNYPYLYVEHGFANT